MKPIKILIITTLMLVISNLLFAKDKILPPARTLLIYDFTISENLNKNSKKYRYYSKVIPETISKSLQKLGIYSISREPGPLLINESITDRSERVKYFKKVRELGLKYNSDFIITGKYSITDKALNLNIVIFNIKGEDIKIIEHESDETGVLLKKTTDILSGQINDAISVFEAKNRESAERSPFLTLYTPFSLLTTGVDGGYLFFMGDWKSVYNNKLYISPFINLDLTDNFSLSARLMYLQTDNEDMGYSYSQQVRILSGSLSICCRFSLLGGFGIAFSAGGGRTGITVTDMTGTNSGQPFDNTFTEKKILKPNVDASAYFTLDISSFNLRAGVHGKRIFYNEKPMDMGIVFGGIGFHF